jgi:hypothetical protein
MFKTHEQAFSPDTGMEYTHIIDIIPSSDKSDYG